MAYGEKYGEFLTNPGNAPGKTLDRERDLFGIDHCEAGRSLASWWNLPESLSRVMAHHHDAATPGEFDVLAIVHLSCSVADALGFEAIHQNPSQTFAELLMMLSERDRNRLPFGSAELALRIAATINSIEAV